jgi:dTDP-4-amino-4,6-dideoxygalactose transaminase
VLMNDFRTQWSQYGPQVLEAVERVGESGWLILGKEVAALETALSEYWGLAHCVGCASGLDAIEIALRCAGLRAGQKVLTTPLTAFATSLAVTRAGGVPVFVDVDDSGLLDLDLCRAAFAGDEELRFMVPVHLYGHALDLERLEALRDEFGLQIVEDCAQAIGARSRGAPVGSVGEFAATSFYPTKNLGAMGDGGAVLTIHEGMALSARVLRDYGQTGKFEHEELGLNSRLDELHAAILHGVFLPELRRATERRCEIASRYRAEINHPDLIAPAPPEGSESVWHLYPLVVSEGRNALRDHLESRRIASGVHYPILNSAQQALAHLGATPVLTPLPRAQHFADHELSIPIHPFLSDEDVDRVVDACNSWRA